MSEESTHVDDHGHAAPSDDGHGHAAPAHDDHGHGESADALGPIDWQKWAFAIVGGIGGLIVLVFFFAAIS